MADVFRGRDAADEEIKKFDVELHAVTTSDAMHRLIHDGMVFHASDKVLGVADGATIAILFRVHETGPRPHVHNVNVTYGQGDIDAVAYRHTVVDTEGTPIPIFNVNQASVNMPTLTLFRAPTTLDIGEVIHTIWAPPTPKKVGGNTSVVGSVDDERWILEPGSDYMFRVTNNSGKTIDMAFEISWFEVSYDN